MIKIAVTGACGRMGGLIIENILKSDELQLVCAIDITNIGKDIGEVNGFGKLDVLVADANNIASALEKSKPDVLIDFTIATASVKNVVESAKHKVNLVVGTTGFTQEQRSIMESAIIENGVSAVISPNYSIGVNVFWGLLAEAAKRLGDYDIEIIEAHHNKKKDAPSGTAVKAAQVISETLGGKEYVYGREGLAPRGKEIGIHAVRGGDIVGDHTVLFAGDGERIEIKHQAHSRQAFAKGAVKAAKWVAGVKSGIYEMRDVLGIE
ncbi:MAG: 4-hydroxy-tetrahydrodipicolinate reductase [Candidatus Methanoperedens sp.]|jgi:4-hydroxy-tetrahydrodipicolinate reductase|nr:4-hydroxy-tetrahydrodipicolinate reductase [Candidatus Methanoperedens sp.]PKL54054.1 MAG: 4-hydroxy-tetrahydrodipicolinate reductase [Candidatus Methanoperedenaceae archaeon HGW-Methanoperedenaceae-1]